MRAGLGIVAVVLSGCCISLGEKVANRIQQYQRELPVGAAYSEVKAYVEKHGLPYSADSAERCEENAKMTSPSYQPRGGPCIFALDRVGSTWYGFDTAIQLRLLFDKTGSLAHRDFHQIHTFL